MGALKEFSTVGMLKARKSGKTWTILGYKQTRITKKVRIAQNYQNNNF